MSSFLKLQKYIKTSFNQEQKERVKQLLAEPKFRGLQHLIFGLLWGSDLRTLALLNYSDKWGTHWYAQHYMNHFQSLRRCKLNILEIGVGGYNNPKLGGGSLRMWRTYFPNSNIYAIDIYDKSFHEERRIKIFKGSQIDEAFLSEVIQKIGKIDIIIDDGSHQNAHVLASFKLLFPHLSENGIYVVEDTQTSYYESFGGSSQNLNNPETTMGFLKQLTDCLNHVEFEINDYEPSYFDKHIIAMHFYHNIVFIQKGLNNEKSNWRKN